MITLIAIVMMIFIGIFSALDALLGCGWNHLSAFDCILHFLASLNFVLVLGIVVVAIRVVSRLAGLLVLSFGFQSRFLSCICLRISLVAFRPAGFALSGKSILGGGVFPKFARGFFDAARTARLLQHNHSLSAIFTLFVLRAVGFLFALSTHSVKAILHAPVSQSRSRWC